MLSKVDGLTVLERLRARSPVPVGAGIGLAIVQRLVAAPGNVRGPLHAFAAGAEAVY